jgi:hypothetical protein
MEDAVGGECSMHEKYAKYAYDIRGKFRMGKEEMRELTGFFQLKDGDCDGVFQLMESK